MIVGDITNFHSEVNTLYTQLNNRHDNLLKLGNLNYYVERDLLLLRRLLEVLKREVIDKTPYTDITVYVWDATLLTWVQKVSTIEVCNLTTEGDLTDILRYINMIFNTDLIYNFKYS